MEDYVTLNLVQLIAIIIVFFILYFIGVLINKKVVHGEKKLFDPKQYLPVEEIHSLRQVGFLVLMASCFICALYILIFPYTDVLYITFFDILLSLYVAVTFKKESIWKKILLLLLIPYGSLSYVLFGFTLVSILDLVHVPVLVYFMKYYYDQFKEYTEANGLGITILLLFAIVFISFLLTVIFENHNPLNAIVMVSNAFTSNGYSVLGTTVTGKLNSILLVWSGFILSSVGTATLTAAILTKHFNKKFDKLEGMINKNNEDDFD